MNVTGIVFANDGTLGDLTEKRTMASLPFGGRYRQIDFALSNLACAGIHHIGIVTRHNYQSLMNHVGSGEEWGLEMEEGGLEYLTPYSSSSTSNYRGKLESLHAAMSFLEYGDDEYLIMVDAAIVSNVDLLRVLNAHIESGKDITVVTKSGIADSHRKLDLAVKLDAHGEVEDIAVDYAAPCDYEASMDIFVLSRKWLMNQVQEHIARNLYHMDRDLVLGLWKEQKATLNVYRFGGVALYNDTVEEYFRNNLALTQKEIREDLFGRNHPIYTKVRDRVPTYYGEDSAIKNCSVADGCILGGTATNSVLFRQVTIYPTAVVKNCVIMNDTVVNAGVYLENVILDKDVVVRPGTKLIGTPANPVVIKRGEIV